MVTLKEALQAREHGWFVGRARELDVFRSWLSSSDPEILVVSGIGGVGKTALLGEFSRLGVQEGRSVLTVDLGVVPRLPAELNRRLGHEDIDAVVAQLNTDSPLILLDTAEKMADLSDYVRRELLPRLEVGVRTVIAGRFPFDRIWREIVPVGCQLRALALGGLGGLESREYLNRRGITTEPLTTAITRASAGHPLALSLAADLVAQLRVSDIAAVPEWHLMVRSLVEQFLSDVADKELRDLLEACSVVRQFDESMLEAVMGLPSSTRAFEQLSSLAIVQPAEHGLMIHDTIRRMMADDLRWRHPQRFNQLRHSAIRHFRERMKTAPRWDREWLVAERLSLTEEAWVQSTVHAFSDPGTLWVDHPGTADVDELLEIFRVSVAESNPFNPAGRDLTSAELVCVLGFPGTMLTVARDRDGKASAFGMILPVCCESTEVLTEPMAALVQQWQRMSGQPLASTVTDAKTFMLLPLCLTVEGVNAGAPDALIRDGASLLERSPTLLASTSDPAYQAILEAFGFTLLPGARGERGQDRVYNGYVLDLVRIGFERWTDALFEDRPVPKGFTEVELQSHLNEALRNWHDDEAIARSPLVTWSGPGPDELREFILSALELARASGPATDELAYEAIRLSFIERLASHERIAERLNVSRSSYFRLLKRGVAGIASVWRDA